MITTEFKQYGAFIICILIHVLLISNHNNLITRRAKYNYIIEYNIVPYSIRIKLGQNHNCYMGNVISTRGKYKYIINLRAHW